ncbi:nucleotidyltransferase domain-containing protein [Candidatus Micrarchaeota archaeon]|nr:nucleotidyltransferase domain-containing protein [Candidatus Micrarchaeota archaeon]
MVQIFKLLNKKSNSNILRHFLENPTTRIHAELLRKQIKIAKKSLLDGLCVLAESEILKIIQIGRTKQYYLNRDNVIVKQLKILYNIETIIPLLKKLQNESVEAYLYGSAARGENIEKSDVDLLIIGHGRAADTLSKLQNNKKVEPVYFTFVEYAQLARKDKPFYERIEKDKIRLI